jgi:hypothetical protein
MADPKKSRLYCQERPAHEGGTYYAHFCSHPRTVKLYDEKLPVLAVDVEQTEAKFSRSRQPDVYWAFWDYEKKAFNHVYVTPDIVSMCFPYGVEAAIEHGEGELLPVKVTFVEEQGELVPEPRKDILTPAIGG